MMIGFHYLDGLKENRVNSAWKGKALRSGYSRRAKVKVKRIS